MNLKKTSQFGKKEKFGNINLEIKETKRRLGGMQKALDYSRDHQLITLEKDLQKKISSILDYEESI